MDKVTRVAINKERAKEAVCDILDQFSGSGGRLEVRILVRYRGGMLFSTNDFYLGDLASQNRFEQLVETMVAKFSGSGYSVHLRARLVRGACCMV